MCTRAVAVAVVFALGTVAHAGPEILTYQGTVLLGDRQPARDGTYSVRFTVYDAESTGSARWTETDSVEVVDGVFSTILGDGTPFATLFSDHAALWMGMEIDLDGDGFEVEEIYAPRQRLAGAAWAVEADRLQGLDKDYFQRRVTGAAPAGEYIRGINADGTIVTGVDRDTHDWPSVTGKPPDFPPSPHAHDWGQIGGIPPEFPPAPHLHDWGELNSVPAGFADGIDDVGPGTIAGVVAGAGLTGGGTSGAVSLAVAFGDTGTSELVARADHTHPGTDVLSAVTTATVALSAGQAPWSGLTGVPAGFADGVDNDSGGDITDVNAGTGLSGGGASGNVSLAVRFEGSGTSDSAARANHTHALPDLTGVLADAQVTDTLTIQGGAVDNDSFSAYSDLTAEGRLDNSDGADLLTRSQADGRYGTSMTWIERFSGVLATPNTGYVCNLSLPISVTLPTSASMSVGDRIRVTGVGPGGTGGGYDWAIFPQAGQKIRLRNLKIPVWKARHTIGQWRDIASSADGTKLVVCAGLGFIYTSTDSGATWVQRETGRDWRAVASSADGVKLVACVEWNKIFTSTDSGASWTPREANRQYRGVASSSDGTKLVACVAGGPILTSTDSGGTWTPRDSVRNWRAVASSADGTKLVACVQNGQIYTSTDSGVTWTPRDSSRAWIDLASSADGTRLYACVGSEGIYGSTDSGVTWTATSAPTRNWMAIDTSSDGTQIVAAPGNGRILISSDSGMTWTPQSCSRYWSCIATSADGSKLAACQFAGLIYTHEPSSDILEETTVGTNAQLAGSADDAVELQYVGSNTFIPLSHKGTLGAQ